jgi:hypothetical protein
MTWFNFLKRPVVLHCYTNRADVFNFTPIKKSNEFIPNWWKAVPKTKNNPNSLLPGTTIKTCAGFIDLYNAGFMVPMWSDFAMKVGPIDDPFYLWQYSDGRSHAEEHPQIQRGDAYPTTHYQHLKLITPWLFRCDEDIKFLLTGPTWNIAHPEKMHVLTGVVNYKYVAQVNINTLFIKHEVPSQYDIAVGDPVLHIIPLTERKVVIKTHLVDDTTFKNIDAIGSDVCNINRHKFVKQVVEAKGCPFHFKSEK